MPNKGKSSSKSSSAEGVEGCEDAEFDSINIPELLQLQERLDAHLDNLYAIYNLDLLDFPFQVIGVSETRENVVRGF